MDNLIISEVNSNHFSQTVIKAITLFEMIAFSDHPIKIRDLAEMTKLPRPTVYRLVHTLQACGYVKQNPDNSYELSTKLLKISRQLLDHLDIRVLAKPILRHLRSITNETAILAVREGENVFYIGNFESTQALRSHSRMGTLDPIYSTAVGKAMLAFLPRQEMERMVAELKLIQLTRFTITNRTALIQQLHEVHTQGCAIEKEENEEGICSIAAPIFEHHHRVAGALGVSGPSSRLNDDQISKFCEYVVEAGNNLSRLMGYEASNK